VRDDDRLTSGRGRYVADLRVPGCLEAAFVRSPLPHADLRGVDAARATAMPGVALVLTADDLTGVGDVPTMFGADDAPPWRPLATERVRHDGEPVALVAADDRYRAEDAGAAVGLDLGPRPGRATPGAVLDARARGDEPLYPGHDDLALEKHFGPEVAEETWEGAHVVVDLRLRQQLLAPTSLEARAILVEPHDDGTLTVHCSHQFPHGLATGIAGAFGLDVHDVRVIVPDAGGAFGSKSPTYPEYLAVVAAARRLGRPVRWTEDRTEALTAASRGRGQDQRVRIAADARGRFLAIDLEIDADVGAHPLGAALPGQTGLAASGAYAVAEVHARVRSLLTTTTPTFAYRGAGRPEAAYAVERAVDQLATELGTDPVELRRRNLIREFPYDTPTGRRYDSGDYEACLARCVELLEPGRWRAEQTRRRDDPAAWPLGVGIACYVERSGGEPGILEEYGSVTAEPGPGDDGGTFTARVGTSSTGQPHGTVFAALVADRLDVAAEDVRLVEGDTGEVPEGHGTFASRSTQMGGAALAQAADALVDSARGRAADAWGVDVDGVVWDKGTLRHGTRAVPAGELATEADPLRAEYRFASPPAFPYGSYGAVVEVDPELGAVHLLRLVAVDDYGTVLDHTAVHGQTLGSIAQGLGQVLTEGVVLDDDGATLMPDGLLDYLLPTAAEMPRDLRTDETAVPAPDNPLGAKGAGEAGCIGVPPAVVNAVADALRTRPGADPTLLQMPLTPHVVWEALRGERGDGRSGGRP
jgi:aerobic carbon-monoxide dehydrogenase large subunit